jgi:hypothetical protein
MIGTTEKEVIVTKLLLPELRPGPLRKKLLEQTAFTRTMIGTTEKKLSGPGYFYQD